MSVAIRAITRLQDADDINVTLGAGQDGYALTWDNASGAFVASQISGVYLPLSGGTMTGAITVLQSETSLGLATGVAGSGIRFYAGAVILQGGSGGIRTLTVGGSGLSVNSAVNFTNGSAAAPATAFVSATSTGIFRASSSNGLGVSVAGVEQFRVENGLFGWLNNATTNAVSNLLTLTHNTSGTAAAGFGAGLLYQLESSTTAAQSAARIQALWYEATHATFKADLVGTAYDAGGEREGWRVRGNGSAAAIGFLGAAPIARIAHVADPAGGATVDAEARSAINSILATLEGFGFHATS